MWREAWREAWRGAWRGASSPEASRGESREAAQPIGIVAYSPICRGLLGGAVASIDALAPTDFRRIAPRFAEPAAFEANKAKLAAVEAVAKRLGATPAQVSLAWLHAKGADVFPIPGSRSPARIAENVAAADLVLSPADIRALDQIGEAVGDRYGHGMANTFNWREKLQSGSGTAAPAAAKHSSK